MYVLFLTMIGMDFKLYHVLHKALINITVLFKINY